MASRVVAVDGPSASGKSTTARAVARTLGFGHLDSGVLYRGVTLVALSQGGRRIAAGREASLPAYELLQAAEDRGLMLQSDGESFSIYLDGEPVETQVRSAEVTAGVSSIAAIPEVREWVNERLRQVVRAGLSVVVDGRDIGTVVFPDARLKVFLTASPETRARRRLAQRGEDTGPQRLQREAALLAARDHADSTRAVAPLRQAEDAVLLDTTSLTFEQQVERIVALARERFPEGGR